jgi:hypothetical protein
VSAEVTSIAAITRQRAEERIALAESMLAIGVEMQENAENLQAAARKELAAGCAELRALDALSER